MRQDAARIGAALDRAIAATRNELRQGRPVFEIRVLLMSRRGHAFEFVRAVSDLSVPLDSPDPWEGIRQEMLRDIVCVFPRVS